VKQLRRFAADLANCLILAGVVLLLYRKVLRLWWTYDDAFHLRQTLEHSVSAILFSRDFWQQLPNEVFTPLLFLSLKADFSLFGPNARLYYIHQVVVLILCGWAAYFVARLWLPRLYAIGAALLMLIGPPMCEIAEELYHRHYLEGLLFSLAASGCFVLGIRRNRIGLSVASAFLYLLAAAAKEVYVPLPLLLAAIPEGTSRDRFRHLVPSAAALFVYATWRIAMLGPQLTGYGFAVPPKQWPILIATLPLRAIRRIGGSDPWAAAAFLILLAVALILAVVKARRAWLIILIGTLVTLLPIVPVATRIETRYVLTAWILLALCAAFVSRPVILFALLIAAAVANRAEWRTSYSLVRRMVLEARFFAQTLNGDVLIEPVMPPSEVGEIRWLARKFESKPAAGAVLYDRLPACRGLPGANLYAYDSLQKQIRRTTTPVLCNRVRSAPLATQFRYGEGALWWKLGPYDEGTYKLIAGDGAQGFEVERTGGYRLASGATMLLRARYDSPAGWLTYSPDFAAHLREGWQIEWHR
jgi:hypothetical protein